MPPAIQRVLAATGAATVLLGGALVLSTTAGAQSAPSFTVTPGAAQVGDVVTFDSTCAGGAGDADIDAYGILTIDGTIGSEVVHLEFRSDNDPTPLSGTAVVPAGWIPGGTFDAQCTVGWTPTPGSSVVPGFYIYPLDSATLAVSAAPVTTTSTTVPASTTTTVASAPAARAAGALATPRFTG